MFDKEPPYSQIKLSDEEISDLKLQKTQLDQEHSRLSECLKEPTLDSCDDVDLNDARRRLQEIGDLLNAIWKELTYIPDNEDYDRDTDKLEPCA